MNEIEKSCESISSFYDKLNESRINTEKDITKLLDTNVLLKHDLRQMNKNYDQLQEDFLELKTRSMQENLIFFGIDEHSGENTESVLRNLFVNKVLPNEQELVDNITFDRVHRLGKKKIQKGDSSYLDQL